MRTDVETIQEKLNERGDKKLEADIRKNFESFSNAFWLGRTYLKVDYIVLKASDGKIAADVLMRLLEQAIRESHQAEWRSNATKEFLEDVEQAKASIDDVLNSQSQV